MNTPTNKTLSELYAEFKEHLDNPSTAFQDAALNTAVKIEAAVREILEKESHPIDPRRIRRYGLDTEHPNLLHITLAQEAQVLKDTIDIGLSTHHLLNQIIRRQNHIAQILEPKSYAEICEQLGIVMSMYPDGKERPFVPTTGRHMAPQTGSGAGFEAQKDRIPKFLECIRLLPEIATPDGGHIDTRDLLVDIQDTTPESMLRTLPYAIIRIPRLNRTILVNDEHGQATFVLQGLIDISLIQTTNKDDLVTTLWAQRIIYHPTHWKTRLERYLLNNWEHTPNETQPTQQTQNTPTAYLSDNPDDTTDTYTLTNKNEPTDRIKNLDLYPFFLDAALIREALLKFAEHISMKQRGRSAELREWEELKSLEEKEKYNLQRLHMLSTTNPSYNTRITLKNGESMTWETYLRNARKLLDSEMVYMRAQALSILKERAGFITSASVLQEKKDIKTPKEGDEFANEPFAV